MKYLILQTGISETFFNDDSQFENVMGLIFLIIIAIWLFSLDKKLNK